MINFLSVNNLLIGSGIAIPESITTANLAVPVFLILNQKLDHQYLKFFSSALPAHSTAQNDIHFPEEKLYRTDKQYRSSQSGNSGRLLFDWCPKWRYRSFFIFQRKPFFSLLPSGVLGASSPFKRSSYGQLANCTYEGVAC